MTTKIQWCDETWNPITGCSPVSEACDHCYAERMSKRLAGRFGYPKDNPFRVTFHPDRLEQPLEWKKSKRIFVCSMSDIFHEDVEFKAIELIWDTMFDCSFKDIIPPYHDFLILTKRPEFAMAFAEYMEFRRRRTWYPNIWLGVTLELQKYEQRVIDLLQIPAAVRFLSLEPLLGPINIYPNYFSQYNTFGNRIDWVIVGGETGSGARPMHPDWVRSIRDQCVKEGVPFFFKGWGEWVPQHEYVGNFWTQGAKKGWGTIDINGNWFLETTPWNGNTGRDSETREYVMYRVGKKKAGRLLDGWEWNEYPKEKK